MLEDMNRLNLDFQLPGRNSMPNDPLATGFAHLSYVRSVAGDLAEARAVSDEGLLLAEAAPFPVGPFTVCYLLGMRASVELAHEEFVRRTGSPPGRPSWPSATASRSGASCRGSTGRTSSSPRETRRRASGPRWR